MDGSKGSSPPKGTTTNGQGLTSKESNESPSSAQGAPALLDSLDPRKKRQGYLLSLDELRGHESMRNLKGFNFDAMEIRDSKFQGEPYTVIGELPPEGTFFLRASSKAANRFRTISKFLFCWNVAFTIFYALFHGMMADFKDDYATPMTIAIVIDVFILEPLHWFMGFYLSFRTSIIVHRIGKEYVESPDIHKIVCSRWDFWFNQLACGGILMWLSWPTFFGEWGYFFRWIGGEGGFFYVKNMCGYGTALVVVSRSNSMRSSMERTPFPSSRSFLSAAMGCTETN